MLKSLVLSLVLIFVANLLADDEIPLVVRELDNLTLKIEKQGEIVKDILAIEAKEVYRLTFLDKDVRNLTIRLASQEKRVELVGIESVSADNRVSLLVFDIKVFDSDKKPSEDTKNDL